MNLLGGIFPPLTTPFDPDGGLLLDRFRENLIRYLEHPLAGFVVLGSNGESPYLSDDEKLILVREARALVPADRTLIVGAGRESTRHCIDFVRKVAGLGADCVLIGTPCYFKGRMTEEVLHGHFSRVADASPVPVLVYNVPQFTGVGVTAGLMERLAAHQNIAGIKESAGDLFLQAEIRRRTPARFGILVGAAPTLLPSLIQGAAGGIVAVACALPGLTVDLYEAFRAGDWPRAAELQARLSPMAAAVTTGYGIPGLKAAMDLEGFYGGPPRLPLLPLDEAQRAALAKVFAPRSS